jgi:hypothetical protein
VTATFANERVDAALETLGRLAGIAIHLHGPIERTVTVELRHVPVPDALARLLAGESVVFVYPRDGAPAPTDVHVYPGVARPPTATAAAAEVQRSRGAGGTAMPSGSASASSRDAPESTTPGSAREPAKSTSRTRALGVRDGALDSEARETLASRLGQDANPEVRAAAAEALGNTWDESAVAPLAHAVATDPGTFVRAAAAQALGETWSEAGMEPLTQALLIDPGRAVREEAALGLGQIGDPGAVPALTQALGDADTWVRLAAVDALAAIASPDATAALLDASKSDADDLVRSAAGQAVAQILAPR